MSATDLVCKAAIVMMLGAVAFMGLTIILLLVAAIVNMARDRSWLGLAGIALVLVGVVLYILYVRALP